jgi:O-antigen/teichoic acid export membrane protein
MFVVLSPAAAVFIFFARDIMYLWLGPQFAVQSTHVLQLVTMVFFINAFAIIPFTSVQALGRPDLKAILDLLTIPVYFASAWWLMRHLGVNGAALAKVFVTISDCTFLYFFASRLKAFSLRDCVSGPLFRTISLSACLFFAVFAIHSMNLNLLVRAVLVVVCFLIYVFLFWVFAVDEEDRITIFGLRQRALAFLAGRRATAAAVQLTGSGDATD